MNDIPNSCLLHVGKPYLLQNDHFKQYSQSIILYQTATQVRSFESSMKKFINIIINLINVDKSVIHEILGLYYESFNKYQQPAFQFIMSIHHDHQNNNTNDLIMVSHWKIAKVSSRYLNNSNTTQAMKYFSIAVDQSSQPRTCYEFNFKIYSIQFIYYQSAAQLDQLIDKKEDIFSQFDQCTLCLSVMIDSYQSIRTNDCTYQFHTNCISKRKRKVCRSCRVPQP